MASPTQTTGGRLSLPDAVSWALTSAAMALEPAADGWKPSLREYVETAWPVLEASNPFVPGWHIDAICEHLEAVTRGEIRQLLINMPPRHAKSLIVSVMWPTWEWTFHPSTRWLYSSYAGDLSTRDSVKCRNLILSPWYQMRWGNQFRLADDQNLKTRFSNNRSGYRISTSVGGVATGEGGDRIVVDDPHNVLEASSDAKRESVLTWWDQTMSSRLNNPKTGTRVIVMQRVHEGDLSGHVLKNGGYQHLCLPARFEAKRRSATCIGWADPRQADGDLLWPAQFGEREIAKLERDMGSYGAAGQLQQRPSPAEGGLIKRSWVQYYRALPERFDELIQSWDMAFKDTKGSDFVAGHVWGRIGADKYLVARRHGRMDMPASVKAVREITQAWPQARVKLVEDKANGPAVIATLRHEIPGLIAVNPEGGKVARVNAVAHHWESGNVYVPHPDIASWVDPFIEELVSFPNAAHDDDVDAMSQALLRFDAEPPLPAPLGGTQSSYWR